MHQDQNCAPVALDMAEVIESHPFVVPLTDPIDDPFNPEFSSRMAMAAAPPSKAHKPAEWFDIRVFYVRVCCFYLEDTPDTLTMHYLCKNSNTSVEVNGGRISERVHPFLILKRDRMDKESGEVTYVSTDNLRIRDDLSFKVSDKNDRLISGTLKRLAHESYLDSSFKDSKRDNSQQVSYQDGWTMECACVMKSPKCTFTRKRPMFSAVSCPPPCVEVYMAGRVSGSPLVLTESVKLIAKRKYQRSETMDTIAEDEASERPTAEGVTKGFEECTVLLFPGVPDKSSITLDCCSEYDDEGSFFAEQEGFCKRHDYACFGCEEGQLSWFKAGVRVGVGIGLGICLGLGLGVGVLVRSYQSCARAVRALESNFL